jgi:hypothetical protein
MNWHSIFSAAIWLGKAVLVVGVVAILVFGYVSQTQKRLSKYKRTGRLMDLLKMFSRY